MKGWGPKSSVCPSKPRETKLFWRDMPGFCRDIAEVPEKLRKKCLGSISGPIETLIISFFKRGHSKRGHMHICAMPHIATGEACLLAAGAFLPTVELLCLQSIEVLLRHTFPLEAKKLNCKQESLNCK